LPPPPMVSIASMTKTSNTVSVMKGLFLNVAGILGASSSFRELILLSFRVVNKERTVELLLEFPGTARYYTTYVIICQ